ncbi:MAG: hypothetical protein EBS07_11575, partial [Sphingobacteriia bacterium]|nr:hypothetical protein [Sphingobacteriia bacterium]
GAYGIYWPGFSSVPYESGMIFENNRLTDMSGYGVFMQFMDGAVIRNNFIDLTANATTSTQYGIFTQSMYNSTRVLRNDIRAKNYGAFFSSTIGTSSQRALIANNFINVIHPTGNTLYGSFVDYFHNTVTTTNPVTTSLSYTLYDQGGSFKTYYNNIFRNNGVAGSNNYAAFVITGTANIFDYNDYWWPIGTTNIANWSSFGNFSPTQWFTLRSALYGGGNSINVDPQFLSSTNLRHLNNGLNTGINLLSQVNTDIDGITRTSPITVGAAEFKPISLDASVSAILSNPPCSGPSNVQVRVFSGGTTTLTSATINWSVNGVTQTPFSWTGSLAQGVTSGPVTLGTFNFVLGTSYTIAAWTSSPNGGTDGNTTNDLSTIATTSALGGTYTIGSGGSFSTFGAAITALQSFGVCSPTVFQVINGTYAETLIIPQISGTNSINTITFESQSGDSTLVSLIGTSTYVVFLNGADFIRFRKMTIQNGGSGRVFDFANGAQFNRIENCRILGFNTTSVSTSFALIFKGSSGTNELGTEIRNNVMQYGAYGIYWSGFSSVPYESGMIFENNRLTDISGFGVWIQFMDGAVIRNNFIDLTANTTTNIQYGIFTQSMYNSTRILSNDIRSKNYGVYFSSTIGAPAFRARVANNFINATHPTGNTLYGLFDVNGTYVDYYHNTVTTTNPNTSASYTLWDQGGSFKTYYNNIFRNNGVAGTNNFAAYVITGTSNLFDYNDYWWPSGTTNIAYWSSLGNFSPSQWFTLRSSTYGGSNSVNIDPQFLSATNLRHYTGALNAGINLISQVGTDIDGATRTNPVTIGADEYKPAVNDASVSAIVSNPPCIGVSNVQVSLTNFGTATLTSATLNWSINGVSQTPFSWTGSLNQFAVATPVSVGTFNFVQGTSYTIVVSSSNPNGVTDGNTINDQSSITTTPGLGGTYTIGTGGNYASFGAAVGDLQNNGVCGPVVFRVLNGIYAETVTIPQISGANSINTITFESQSGDSTLVNLQGSGTYVLFLNGADFIRIRKMTLQNTGTGRVVDFGNTAQFNRLENCRIIGFNTTGVSTTSALIFKGSTSTNESGTVIRNNVMQYGSYGVYWAGFTSSPYEPGMIIENNRITEMAGYGLFVQYMNGAVIQNNNIDLTANVTTNQQYGIFAQYMYNSTRILANDVRVKNFAAYFNYIYGSGGLRAQVANNFFTVIHPTGSTLFGIYDVGSTFIDYYHNTVTTTNPSSANTSYTLYDDGGSFKTYYNNIFRNNGIAGANNFAAYVFTGTSNLFDYNDYWCPTGSTNLAYWSSFGNFSPSQWFTFRSNLYGGGNSINIDPQFLSSTNLRHYNVSLNAGINLLSQVNRDIDRVTRTTPVTIGASEFKPVANDAAISSINNLPPCPGIGNVSVNISNYGTATLTSATINWSINGVSQTPFSWTGSLPQNGTPIAITLGTFTYVSNTNYSIVAATSNPNGVTDGNTSNDQLTVNTASALSGTYTVGSGGTYASFGAAISALQSFGVCGPTVFDVLNGTYTETLIIPQISGANSINTITFRSQSGDSSLVLLQGSSTYVLFLNGADHIRIRAITLQNTGSGRVIDFANNAQFNRIENCRILGFNTTTVSTSFALIFKGSSGTNELGTEIRNNVFQFGSYGIYWPGFSSVPYESGMIFENNRLTDMSGYGVWMQFMDAAIIRNNFIDLTTNATTSTQYGIFTQSMYNRTRILSNDVRAKNFGGYFVNTFGTSGQRALVANNFFNATHPTGTTIYGLYEV